MTSTASASSSGPATAASARPVAAGDEQARGFERPVALYPDLVDVVGGQGRQLRHGQDRRSVRSLQRPGEVRRGGGRRSSSDHRARLARLVEQVAGRGADDQQAAGGDRGRRSPEQRLPSRAVASAPRTSIPDGLASRASARTVAISRSPEARRRLELLDRARQQVHGRLQPSQLDAAGLALGEMTFQLGSLAFLQGTERVRGQVAAVALVARGLSWVVAHRYAPGTSSPGTPSARVALIFSRPRRIRPFTVPSGAPSISAISEWLKPPK